MIMNQQARGFMKNPPASEKTERRDPPGEALCRRIEAADERDEDRP